MDSQDTIDVTSIARPFFWIKAANILLIWTGVNAPFAALALLLKGQMSSLAAVVVFVPLTAVLGFSGWIAWKNVTVLNAVIQRGTLRSLSLLAAFAFFLSLLADSVKFDTWDPVQRRTLALTAVATALLGAIATASAISVAWLRRRRLEPLGMKLRDFLRTSKAGSAESGRRVLPPRNRARGWWLIAGGSAIMLGSNLVPGPEGSSLAPFGTFAFFLFLYSRSQFQSSAAGLLESDPRPPVLFLRSFKDEERINYWRADFGFVDFSLEARVAEHFYSWGPFIAVDAPRHKNIAIGAARASFTDADWQTGVVAWMDAASTIILLAGTTRWLEWELRTVIERGHTGKLIVCFPQSRARWLAKDKRLRTRKRNAAARLEVIRTAFAGTEWAARLSEPVDPRRIRSMVFGADGRVTMVTARSRNRNTYHLAVLIGHYLLLQGDTRGSTPQIAPA